MHCRCSRNCRGPASSEVPDALPLGLIAAWRAGGAGTGQLTIGCQSRSGTRLTESNVLDAEHSFHVPLRSGLTLAHLLCPSAGLRWSPGAMIAYLRVSTDKQADRGVSLPRQCFSQVLYSVRGPTQRFLIRRYFRELEVCSTTATAWPPNGKAIGKSAIPVKSGVLLAEFVMLIPLGLRVSKPSV